jgi:hypothetical protein
VPGRRLHHPPRLLALDLGRAEFFQATGLGVDVGREKIQMVPAGPVDALEFDVDVAGRGRQLDEGVAGVAGVAGRRAERLRPEPHAATERARLHVDQQRVPPSVHSCATSPVYPRSG